MGRERSRRCAAAVSRTIARLAVGLALATLAAGSVHAHGDEEHGAPSDRAVAASVPEGGPADGLEPEVREDSPAASGPVDAPSRHPYPPLGVPRPLAWLGKFHPPATHFPIALLTVAALAELFFVWTHDEVFRQGVRLCVWTGSVGALVAAPLGWLFSGFRVVDEDWVMTAHRWLGTGTALWSLLLLVLCERAYRRNEARSSFRLTLFAGAALVGGTGFLGGALVYGLDHHAW